MSSTDDLVADFGDAEDCEHDWHYDRFHLADACPGCGAPDIADEGSVPWPDDVVVSGE